MVFRCQQTTPNVGNRFRALDLLLFSKSAYIFVVPMSEWHISLWTVYIGTSFVSSRTQKVCLAI